MSALFNNVQSVVEQALNGTTSSGNMNALASQVTAAEQQLLGLANTTAPNGTYLFGGSNGQTAPFQVDSTGNISYFGDGGGSPTNIGQNQVVSSVSNGEALLTGNQGDGFSSVSARSANAGTGQVLQQGVINLANATSFQQGNSDIVLTFGSGNSYVATQGGSTIGSGTLTTSGAGGATVQLSGMDFQVSGSPSNGDSFTISPARPQSAFSLLKQIQSALSGSASTPAQVAQTNQVLNQSLAGLAQYQQSVTTSQAQNGVMLQAVSNAATGNTAQITNLQTSIDNSTSANTPVVISQLDQTMTALQAAMKAFGTVQGLSLFNYI
jgi:flagellar hook-associated protein 3 FlgL